MSTAVFVIGSQRFQADGIPAGALLIPGTQRKAAVTSPLEQGL
jgi:hypothetical protein